MPLEHTLSVVNLRRGPQRLIPCSLFPPSLWAAYASALNLRTAWLPWIKDSGNQGAIYSLSPLIFFHMASSV